MLSPAIRAIRRIERRLDRPLRVALLGELNSGKTSLANLLARIECLPAAVVSHTRVPTLLYFAHEPEIWIVRESGQRERLRADRQLLEPSTFRVEVGLPSPRLRTVQFLDFPGFGDPRSAAPAVDLAFHHIDAVLWCTVSTQAWKESERTAWSRLPTRLRTHGLLVVTHRDLLRKLSDPQKVLTRLRRDASSPFRDIVMVSTGDALAVMGQENKGLAGLTWKVSGAEALEAALGELLLGLRERRAATALEMTSRVAYRALSKVEKQPTPIFARAQQWREE
jgi:tRNA U34 5-carboxymethylaminomethyl modifying GTPase MnmE/TrmE